MPAPMTPARQRTVTANEPGANGSVPGTERTAEPAPLLPHTEDDGSVRECARCGRPLAPGRRDDARFCSKTCKEGDRRARNRGAGQRTSHSSTVPAPDTTRPVDVMGVFLDALLGSDACSITVELDTERWTLHEKG